MRLFLGIDTGHFGAVAAVNESGDLHEIYDTPITKVVQSGKNKTIYLIREMYLNVFDITWAANGDDCAAVLESNAASPRRVKDEDGYTRGSQGDFQTGYSRGLWEMALHANSINPHLVVPRTWQAKMISGANTKDNSRLACIKRWPDHSALFARKKDEGRADAANMAEYCRRIELGLL